MMASSIAANGSVRGGLLLVRLSPMALPKTFRFQPHRAQDDALLQVTCTYTDTSGRAGATTNQVVLSAATVASAKAASAATGAGGAGGCALAMAKGLPLQRYVESCRATLGSWHGGRKADVAVDDLRSVLEDVRSESAVLAAVEGE